MSLTRKMLKAMGIEDEKIDQIVEAHTEVTDALKADRDQYKEDAEKLKGVQKELDTLKAKGDDGFKEKYDKIKTEFDTYKADVEAKETGAKKESAVRTMLKEIGVSEKRIDSILKVYKLDEVELDEKGAIKDIDKRKEADKTEWADFISTTTTHGNNPATPPAGNTSAEDLGKLSMADYIAARKKG